MPTVKEIVNVRTGEVFAANQNLVMYAKSEPGTFNIIYNDETQPLAAAKYTEDSLKIMNMRDLQTIAEGMNLNCDRRKKDSLIDGILGRG